MLIPGVCREPVAGSYQIKMEEFQLGLIPRPALRIKAGITTLRFTEPGFFALAEYVGSGDCSLFNISTKVTVDNTKALWEGLVALTKKQVLVGVPEEKDSRKNGKRPGNAMLAYIHDKGSPAQGIPPRPFMIPGIAKAQDRINIELLQVAKAQLNKDLDKINEHLEKAGLVTSSNIKRVINEGEGFTPLKRATLLGRLRKRKAARKWDKEKREDVMESMHPLVDTGQLRNSIGYSIVEKT